MPYARKTTGLGALATTLLIVQDDGTTLEDLGSVGDLVWTENGTMARGQANWNGVPRYYFQTEEFTNNLDITAGGDVQGNLSDPTGSTVFMAVSFGPASAARPGTFLRSTNVTGTNIANIRRYTPGNSEIVLYRSENTDTLMLTGVKTYTATDFSENVAIGAVHEPLDSPAPFNRLHLFTDLENGTDTAFEATFQDDVNIVGAAALNQVGWAPGGWSNQDTRVWCLAVFRNTQLSPAQLGLLRDDWFNELLEVPSTGPVLSAPTATPVSPTVLGTSVDSDRAGGTVYSYVSSNASETEATIRASAQQTAPGVVGTVTFPDTTGQPNNTDLYAHFSQAEGGEDSNVVSSTPAVQIPQVSVSAVAAGTPGSATIGNSSATFNDGNGGTWYAGIYADGATPTHAQIKAGTGAVGVPTVLSGSITADPQTVTTIGPFSGLGQSQTYRIFVTAEVGAAFPAQPPMQFDTFATTANQAPNITEQLTVTGIGTTSVDFQMTATDPDDPNVTYSCAVYPPGTNPTDAQIVEDGGNAPGAGGIPNPNPRGALWARSIVLAQGTRYSDTAIGLEQDATYEIEAAVADTQNLPVRFVAINFTTALQGVLEQTFHDEFNAPLANRTNVPWYWLDTDAPAIGSAIVDEGTLDTDAAGLWVTPIQLDNSTLPDGQTGTLLIRYDDAGTLRTMYLRYTKTVQAGVIN